MVADFLTTAACAVLVAVGLAQAAVFATSIYLHRTLAHRALTVHAIAETMFRAILWLTTGLRRREWVAVHRKHHAFTDRAGDPHSPRLLGVWRLQFLNAYYYAREARRPGTLDTFAPDIAEDRLDRLLFSHRWLGRAVGTTLLCATVGVTTGLAAAMLHACLYVGVLAPLINVLGHWRGAKNFENTAHNWGILSWMTGGESLHNNHHAHPRAPKFSMRRWEFDPSWLVIRAFSAVGLIAIAGTRVRLP